MTAEQWRARNLPLCLAAFTVIAPIVLLLATFPGNDRNGFVGSQWDLPLSPLAVAAVLALVFFILSCLSDWELVWGSATLLSVLTTVALFVSAFLHRHLQDRAWSLFAGLCGLSMLTLVLVAWQWARQSLVVVASLAALALAGFILRVGVEHETIPPKWERAHLVAQAKTEGATLKAQFEGGARGRQEILTNAHTALAELLDRTEPPLNVPRDLRDQASEILHQANPLHPMVDSEDVQQFDALLTNQPSDGPPAVPLLGDALHALIAAVKANAARFDSAALDCAIAVVAGDSCSATGVVAVTSHHSWLVAKHNLDVALARTRADVTRSTADKATVDKLVAQVPRTDDEITMLSAVSSGPTAIWRSAFHDSDPALIPGPLGWVLFGSLLLGLLGWLLKLNARQLAGPVDIPADEKVGDELIKVLRVAVLQNVDEPGAAPGSASANPVTTLLGIAGGPLSALSKIVEPVRAIVGRRYGYRVVIDVTGSKADKTAEDAATPTAADAVTSSATFPVSTTVLVRITEVSNGATLTSHVVNAPSAEVAVREAGLWAAGFILNRSSRIPSWAAWEPATARALATMKDEASLTVEVLEQAVREAPLSGLLLVLLGQRYELDERRVEAIDCYARAVAVHPRYRIARYRLAIALAMMRHDTEWQAKSHDDRRDDLRYLQAAIEAQHVSVGDKLGSLCATAPPADAATTFRELAKDLLDGLAKDARYFHRLVSALRRSERDALWSGLAPGSRNVTALFRSVVRSAASSLDERELPKLEKAAADPRSWWQISYNAACGYASASCAPDPERALALLEQTLLRPRIDQLKAGWVRVDPDLDSIRGGARFENIVRQLRAGA